MRSQIPGVVVRLLVKPGDRVKATDPIMVLEAMKMETEIIAGRDARQPLPGARTGCRGGGRGLALAVAVALEQRRRGSL